MPNFLTLHFGLAANRKFNRHYRSGLPLAAGSILQLRPQPPNLPGGFYRYFFAIAAFPTFRFWRQNDKENWSKIFRNRPANFIFISTFSYCFDVARPDCPRHPRSGQFDWDATIRTSDTLALRFEFIRPAGAAPLPCFLRAGKHQNSILDRVATVALNILSWSYPKTLE